jgi:MarR family transcriptional regulator for hemolysin
MTDTRHLAGLFATKIPGVERAWRRECDRALAECGLSAATALPLVAVWRMGDGLRQVVLAEALGIEEASLSPLLGQLCAAGLLERRADSQDRRAKTLHLTEAGAAAVRRAEAVLARVRAHLLRYVDPVDLAAAVRTLEAVERAVGHTTLPPPKDVA